MKKLQSFILPFAVFTALIYSSCDKDDPVIPNEEELITSLKYTLTPTDRDTSIIMTFEDLDGEGGNAPVITGGTLSSNTAYAGTVELLNELENPAGNVTEEVQEEADQHQFFFSVGSGLDLTINYEDTDDGGNPIGIKTSLATGNASSGQITITLRHEPDKSAPGVDTGDITYAGGETDIEVQFDVTIQ